MLSRGLLQNRGLTIDVVLPRFWPLAMKAARPRLRSFINAVNRAFFSQSTLFLDELGELITLEFNKTTKSRVRQILGALGQDGRTLARICQTTAARESCVLAHERATMETDLLHIRDPEHRRPCIASAATEPWYSL